MILLYYVIAFPSFRIAGPSEFAASLNRIGNSCRVSCAVALALRYIPDIQREFGTVGGILITLLNSAKNSLRGKEKCGMILLLVKSISLTQYAAVSKWL